MATILPPFPRLVFTILEPLSLIAGSALPFISPEWFVAEQIVFSPLEPISPSARIVAYQLGNVYLLMAMIGVSVFFTTTEPKVVRNYVAALWIADIGHIGITSWALDFNRLVDIANWNLMTWGNIGATVFLFATRTAYLLGLFGPDRRPSGVSKKLQ